MEKGIQRTKQFSWLMFAIEFHEMRWDGMRLNDHIIGAQYIDRKT